MLARSLALALAFFPASPRKVTVDKNCLQLVCTGSRENVDAVVHRDTGTVVEDTRYLVDSREFVVVPEYFEALSLVLDDPHRHIQ